MFNWLKKVFVSEEASRAPAADLPCAESLVHGDLLDKCAAHKKQGNDYLAQGMLEEAAECYRQAVSVNPGYAEGLLNLGFVLREQRFYDEAEHQLKEAVRLNPKMEDAYYLLGALSQERGNLAGAIENYNKTLELKPDFEIVYRDLSNALFQSGQHESAKRVIKQGLSINPESAESYFYLGNFHVSEKELEQAIACYQQALSIRPDFAEAHNQLGAVFQDRNDLEKAEACYHKALALNPDGADVHNNLGSVFQERGDLGEAEACYRKAIALRPDFYEALSNLGNVLTFLGNLDEAIIFYRQALVLKPGSAEVNNNLGVLFRTQGKSNEAEACYRKAIALKPDFPDAYNNLGAVHIDLGKLEEAISCYRRALEFKPDFFLAHNNLGIVFQQQGKLDKAMACYRQALECAPELHEAKANLLYISQKLCEWKDMGPYGEAVRRAVREVPSIIANRIPPFSFLAISGSTTLEQKICATNWAQRICHPLISRQEKMGHEFKRGPKQKINVAYLSGDFREHPVAQLMAQIFELHDRDQFRISAYSFGPNGDGVMRKRLEKSFDQFIDIRAISDESAARRIYEDKIDILVDLAGYTQGGRSAILALRPAPIRVNYLGYPGTMGAGLVDYLIADRFIIPPELQEHYTEKVAFLPECYMPRDISCQRLAAPSRKDCGLPDEGFVFCSFNQPYKITPDMFDIWCRLLKVVPGSVLWLPSSSPAAESNLCREAENRGVAPERIIWAPRLGLAEEHLARIQCADLFLDTTPYNAHTTCSDALWMGLPVITCVGETFPSRVAGSLLSAIGGAELITYNLDDYYSLALDLATDIKKYENIRNKIIAKRESAPMFDSTKFTRDLEAVYLQMWDEYVSFTHSD